MDVQNATKTLAQLKKCAIDADLYHAWFISFGTLLGAIRPTARKWGEEFRFFRGIMEHDDDMDVSILRDRCTSAQMKQYISNIKDAGLFNDRHLEEWDSLGDPVWCSCRGKAAPTGTKCCTWFWLPFKNYYWHTKGRNWADLSVGKMHHIRQHIQPDYHAVMLGIPKEYLETLCEIEFEGITLNVPAMFGSCLDWWYPGWAITRRGGASAKKVHCIVPNYADPNGWRIL